MSKRGNNEGSIYKREDGRWAGQISLGYVNGKRKRKVIYGKTRKEVAEKLKVALRDQQQGLPVAVERQTVAQFLDRWLADVARPKLRASTLVGYRQKIERYILPALGRHQLAKLEPQQVQAMLNDLHDRGLSSRTVHHTRAILRRALNQALRWGLVAKNAAALADPPRVTAPELRTLDPVEARHFLDAVRGDRLEALYSVALSLGLRRGEALGLRWQDVDFDTGTVSVRVALELVSGRPPRLVEPKTRQSRRMLPLSPVLAAQLKAHRARQLTERLAAGQEWQGEMWGLVFATPLGGPLSGRTVATQFKKHLAAAGLPDVRFHDLRHSCASLLLAQNVHPRVVMEILGHSTITLTMNTYSHVLPQAQRDAIGLIDTLLGDMQDRATGD